MPDTLSRPPRLILASSSRYRRELLERLRVPFDVVVPAVDETPQPGETPEATALRLSEAKARAVAAKLPAGEHALVIGSDQVATYDGLQIGKPGSHDKALAQLQAMRGREVLFHSALCLFDSRDGSAQTLDVITTVRFRNLSDAALDAYLQRRNALRCGRQRQIRRTRHCAAGRDRVGRSDGARRTAADCVVADAAGGRFSTVGGAMSGTLYLIPNTLGEGDAEALDAVLPAPVRARAAALHYYIGENAKTTRAFLKKVGTERPIQEIEIRELNVNTPAGEIDKLLAPILAGTDAGLVSEAGCPAVADPGALLVRRAHERGVKVVPFVGPSSILLALMASGLNGQSFAFHGYLPVDAAERAKRLRDLEQQSRKGKQTQIFIETPYRNKALLDTLLATCAPSTLVCVAVDLTLETETIASRTVADWKKAPALDLHKRPAIFLLLAV